MDAAFASRPFPSATTAELQAAIDKAGNNPDPRMVVEVERRKKVAAGDTTLMTPGERLRHIRNGGTV